MNYIWDLPLVIFFIGTGVFLTLYLLFPQFRFCYHAVRIIIGRYVKQTDKEISSFQTFTQAISTPIGLGSVAGVAIAISTGGPGSIFWMWVAGFLGMAIKMVSVSLGIIFRDPTFNGLIGPMYTIKNGLGKKFYPLALIYSLLTICAAFSAGNIFQSNQMSKMLEVSTGLPPYISSIIFVIVTGLVVIGGITKIRTFVTKIAPLLVVSYTLLSLWVIFSHITLVPKYFDLIISYAFGAKAIIGGGIGISFRQVIAHGIKRAVFSNEAGLGNAAMYDRSFETNPIQAGIVGMLGPLIDTIIVSTITALVILMSNSWHSAGPIAGIELTAAAFKNTVGIGGEYMITAMAVLFAFSTIVTWSEIGQKSYEFLFGGRFIVLFKLLFTISVFGGSYFGLQKIINVSDAILGLILIPNLLVNLLLVSKIVSKLQKYKCDIKAERIKSHQIHKT
ncbi:MAG: sodium:alanine symporter family protein [Bacteriovoracaceae bacterium]|nr:sodium:alanine symporter family protein [Bacteriovoracaceae bacterium]